MSPSDRLSTLLDYIRSKETASEEICCLLDILVDEFKEVEDAQDTQRARINKNIRHISQYLQNQSI